MADPRFFSSPQPISLAAIAARTGAELADAKSGDYLVQSVNALQDASANQLSFLDNRKYKEQFQSTKAGACFIHPLMKGLAPDGLHLLLTPTPYKAYALAAQILYPDPYPAPSINPTASVHATAKIGKECVIEHGAVIGANAVIGDGSWIEPMAYIGAGVELGAGCRIGHGATVSHAILGKRVRLYPGARVGQDGFGFAIDPQGHVKVPQLGCVEIGDFVEIGANTCIDRGTLGNTVIGQGTWIDNLVQIGHNVKVGRGCALAAQVGIAGSTIIGDFVAMGGQVGIAGHLTIGDQVQIAAQSGIMHDLPPKTEWMGYPAVPLKRFLRQSATLNKLIENKKSSNSKD